MRALSIGAAMTNSASRLSKAQESAASALLKSVTTEMACREWRRDDAHKVENSKSEKL